MVEFAVVGCGHIGTRHLEVLQNHPQVSLVAACDTDDEVRTQLSGEHLSLSVYEDYDRMLEQESFDIVNICTPHGLHAEMSMKAVRTGRHVLVEKPMVMTDDAEK